MPRARILVQLSDENGVVVNEYQRWTNLNGGTSLRSLCREAQGWLQAYGDQATPEQWEMERRSVTSRMKLASSGR